MNISKKKHRTVYQWMDNEYITFYCEACEQLWTELIEISWLNCPEDAETNEKM